MWFHDFFVYCFGPLYYNRSQFLYTKHKYRKFNILFQSTHYSTVDNSQALFLWDALTTIYHALLPPSVSERELPTCVRRFKGDENCFYLFHMFIYNETQYHWLTCITSRSWPYEHVPYFLLFHNLESGHIIIIEHLSTMKQ